MFRRLYVLVPVAAALVLGGCGLTLPLSMDVPAGLSATDDQTDQITVSWNEVPGADRYFVYRSRSADGPFWTEGSYGRIPYASTTGTSFVDAPLDPLPFYYRVSAYDNATGDESAPAAAVAGTSVAGPREWQDTQVLFGSFTTARLAIDSHADIVRGYLLSVPDGADARVSVRQITNTGALEQAGSAFADVDGTDPRVADLAVISGSVYVALVNETDSTVELWRYTEASDSFTRVLGGLAPADPARPLVSLAVENETTLWLAYHGADGTAEVRQITPAGPTVTAILPPAPVEGGVGAGDSITALEIASGGGAVVLFYKVTNTAGTNPVVVTDSLGGAVFGSPNWTVSAADSPTTTAVAQAFAVDAASPGLPADRSWVMSVDEASLYLETLSNPGSTVSPADLAGNPDFTETSLALAVDDGTHYLFYQDATEGGALVFRSTDDGVTWSEFSPPDFAQSDDPDTLELAARAGNLYATWISGGLVFVRAYQ